MMSSQVSVVSQPAVPVVARRDRVLPRTVPEIKVKIIRIGRPRTGCAMVFSSSGVAVNKTLTYLPKGGAVNEIDRFRERVRTWLRARYDERDQSQDDDRVDIVARAPDGHQAMIDRAVALQQELYGAGFIAMALPVAYGGHGLTGEFDRVVAEELSLVDAPSLRPLGIGLGLAMPTIMGAGHEQQKQRLVPALVSGKEIWCQLFSEPDAGSDLVSLRTRAVRDGDAWIINGQKVWSSLASDADYGMLLARSDPDSDKPHSGITMFVLPMDRGGVTVRPLVDIAGGLHFNEVFLEDVVLHDDDVLGAVNHGWQVATGTLSGERGGYRGGSGGGRRRRQTERALRASGLEHDANARQRVVDVLARELLLEWLAGRIEVGGVADRNPTAGSLVKLAAGTLEQLVADVVIDLLGPTGLAWMPDDRDGDTAAHGLNASRQSTIAGGTHQVQRNLIGERILGLPREPRS
jgi:alkylation response protein AidB-like acyl-CoA dehydrogenase